MVRLILITLTVLFQSYVWAALGDKVKQIDTDKVKLKAARVTLKQSSNYTVQELSTPTSNIREYISTDGTVFAVSWQGVRRPDLSVLLGSYYAEYSAKDSSRPRLLSRHPVIVTTSNIVVHKSGHMRDVRGVAYIPAQIPAGVDVGELQ